jgi:hypothetical protein
MSDSTTDASDTSDVEIVESQILPAPTASQDCKGTYGGRAKGPRFAFVSCKLVGWPAAGKDYDAWSARTEHKSSQILSQNGFLLDISDLDIQFCFKTTTRFPTSVAWAGPAATLRFTTPNNTVLHTQELAENNTPVEHPIVGYAPSANAEGRITIDTDEGGWRCSVVFLYAAPPKVVPVVEGLGAVLAADEAGKNFTFRCMGGETVKVHKVVLCAHSEYYKRTVDNPLWEMTHDEDSAGAWRLIVASMYETKPLAADLPYVAEALRIADRDDFPRFQVQGWGLLKAMDKDNALGFLEAAWIYQQNGKGGKEPAKRVKACFAVIKSVLASGPPSAWVIEYAALLSRDADLAAFADGALQSKQRKRAKAA